MGFKLKFWFTPAADRAPVVYVTQGAGSPGELIAAKLSRELGYPVTCHPNAVVAQCTRGAHVWRVTWFDAQAEVYCEGWAAVLSCPTAPLRAWVARVGGVAIRLVEERCDQVDGP